MKHNSKSLKLILMAVILVMPVIGVQTVISQQLILAVSPVIPSIPSDGKQHPAFFVTLQDAQGKPHPLPYPINVTITSSDIRILQVPSSITIPAASYYFMINASSTVATRQTVEVTVSASGYQSSKMDAVVEPPSGTPFSLDITLLPDSLLPQAGDRSIVVVTIVDAYGKPTNARKDITVTLSSSNLQIGDVLSKTIKVLKGEFSAKTEVTTTGFPGTTAVTASTTDLKSDSANLNVIGPKPEKIYIWAPTYHLTEERGYVFVGIVDSNLKPVKVISQVTVNLYSSNTTAFSVQSSVNIPAGSWSALVRLTPESPGRAFISASAGDLVSTNIQVICMAQVGEPYALRIYYFPNSLPADEKNYTALIVQAVDTGGFPTKMKTTKRVDIYSSNTDILETSLHVDIKFGKSIANITAVPKYPGTVKVSAMSSDIISSETTATVYEPIPTTVNVMTPPIPSGSEVDACLQLLSSGTLIQAQDDTLITLSSSDTGIGDGNGSTTLLKKEYFAYLKIRSKSPGQFLLTSSGSGIPSSKSQIAVLEVKPSTFSLSYVKPIINYDFPVVVQLISTLRSSAVAYEPVTISLASSNTSNIVLPETVRIPSEGTEVLLYGKALSTAQATITILSEGFNSISVPITPAPINISIKIQSQDFYQVGESANVKALVTLEGNPVRNIEVHWNGTGFKSTSSTTGIDGIAENTLTVGEKENYVEAGINVGGTGYIIDRKMIIGTKGMYHLQVTSNAPVDIQGAGSYIYSQQVPLSAPQTMAMTGLVGAMGGKYYFKGWEGASDSTSNFIVLTMTGDQTELQIRAVYTEDYTGVIYWMIAIATIGAAAIVSTYLFRRREKRGPPPIRPPAPRPPRREDRYPKFRLFELIG